MEHPYLQTIKLYKDTGITLNRRYKEDMRNYCDSFMEFDEYQVGHIANTNALQDFEVKLGISIDKIWDCDMIELEFADFIVIGMISGVAYTNPGLTRVPFLVDSWHTALANGYEEGVDGVLARSHLKYTGSDPNFINLLGEPYVCSDTMIEFPELQQQLNTQVQTMEGVFSGDNAMWVVEVSARVAADPRCTASHLQAGVWSGQVGYREITPAINVPADGVITELLFPTFGLSANKLGGETIAGTMYRFSTQSAAQTFIQNVLRSGLRRQLNIPAGTFTNQPTFMNQVSNLFTSDDGQTQQHYLQYNAGDILGVYRIPLNQLVADERIQTFSIDAFLNDPVHSKLVEGTHPYHKSKLYQFPYTYYKFRTNVGGEFNVIPQSHFHSLGDTENPMSMECQLMFTGGNQPRVVMRISMVREVSGNMTRAFEDWITVRVYPRLTVSVDGQISTDQQWGMESMLSMRNAENSVRHGHNQRVAIAATTGGLAGAGYGAWKGAKMGSIGGWKGAAVGGLIGGVVGALGGWGGAALATELGASQAIIDIGNMQAQGSANAFSSPPNTISGVTGLVATIQPPFSAWHCGANLMELQAIMSQFEDLGETCNIFCNCMDEGEIAPNVLLDGDRPTQFFMFSSISQVDAPKHLKQDIANLFSGGVYIMNTLRGE